MRHNKLTIFSHTAHHMKSLDVLNNCIMIITQWVAILYIQMVLG